MEETLNWLQALVLGIIQGLTEYLPVSSSGHLTIVSNIFQIDNGEHILTLNIALHIATVLSTCVILWKEIVWLFKDLFQWKWNEGTKYIVNILISMIPIAIVGYFFKDPLEDAFLSVTLVGICLMITASLLAFSYWAKPRQRENISPWHAFVIGIAQALAVLPGLSRSGSTIATGLLLGNKKERLAQFSFLMVIPPILGEALLDAKKLFGGETAADTAQAVAEGAATTIGTFPLIIAFLAAFVTGCLACKWMISLVKKGKLIWFALYCAIVGVLTIVVPLF